MVLVWLLYGRCTQQLCSKCAWIVSMLMLRILKLGAIDVQELTTADWEALLCWHMLRQYEQRRLLKSPA